MEINERTYGKIRHILPVQRSRVTVENITFINALLYICKNGCKWRRLPKEYGNWHVIYKRFNRLVKDGIIESTEINFCLKVCTTTRFSTFSNYLHVKIYQHMSKYAKSWDDPMASCEQMNTRGVFWSGKIH